MGLILIIAEKPSVAKKIAHALNVKFDSKTSVWQDDEYIVTNCVGHLFRTKMPENIDEKYKKWSLETLPFFFETLPLEINPSVKDQWSIIKKCMKTPDIEEIVNACDPDDEGERIFREVYYESGFNRKIKATRMWLESVASDNAILDAFNDRKPLNLFDGMYNYSLGRNSDDYHRGTNITRALTVKNGNGVLLSQGRVQTPTVNHVVELELAIRNFKSTKFYKLLANTNKGFVGNYINSNLDNNRFKTLQEAQEMSKKIGTGEALITFVENKTVKESPKNLYNLSDLQTEANKRFKYSPLEVLNICQALYETHGLTTYPRTDENRISPALAEKCPIILKGLPSIFKDKINVIFDNSYKLRERCIAKKDIGAHEAITPVPEKISDDKISKLSTKELNIYKMIVERLLENYYPDAVYETQKIKFVRNDETFETNSKVLKSLGFKSVSSSKTDDEKNDSNTIAVSQGEKINITKLEIKEGNTEPPKRLTEGSLIAWMASPLSSVENKEDKEILKEIQGIGTEATRGAIIEEMKNRGYIKSEKGTLYATDLGIDLIDRTPASMKSVMLTVENEKELTKIKNGSLTLEEHFEKTKQDVTQIVEEIKNSRKEGITKVAESLCKCPHCDGNILKGQYGFYCDKKCGVSINPEKAFSALGLKKLTDNQVKQMFTKGVTSKKAKLVSPKSGKEFEAFLTYEFNPDGEKPWEKNKTGFKFD